MRAAVSRRGWVLGLLAGSMVSYAVWWGFHGEAALLSKARPVITASVPLTASSMLAKLPLAFEPNRGQRDGRVLFVSRNPGYSLFLTARGAVISLRNAARSLTFTWQGANPGPAAKGESVLPGRHNYLRGDDPRHWRRDIPTYAKVRYRDLYPGIDLIYYGRQQNLEYDLVVAPGADPAAIRFGLQGMDALSLNQNGVLRIQMGTQTLTLDKPVIYQEDGGAQRPVAGTYVLLADNQVGFELADYDHSKPLIIDPVLSYSTYLGGGGLDQGKGVAVDSGGNVYVVGLTASGDFPVKNALQNTNAGGDSDVFVAKFDPGGTLSFATYLGGSGADRGFGIAVDGSALYIVGDTTSPDFPTQSAAQPSLGGDIDAFVAKLSKDGSSLLYSTYLGGSRAEEGLGVAVDGSGNAYVAGATLSDNFPTTAVSPSFNIGITQTCYDPSNPGAIIPCSDAYVAKFDPAGNLSYATYLGGYLEDAATAIAVDGVGNAYVTGITYSPTFDTKNGFQQSRLGGFGDAFILQLDASGNVSYGTYLGGGGWDQGQAIAVDAGGNVYVAGATNTSSTSIPPLPLTSALQYQYGGGTYDAFVAKVNPANPAASQLQYLTYLGGGGKDFAFGIAVDGNGNAYVAGETTSTDFPVDSALQSTSFGTGNNGWGDAFVSKIDKSGILLNWSTYLGGGDDDWANGVALDGSGGIYVVGSSFSSDFPTANPYQPASAGNGDAILFKLTDSPVTVDLQLSVSASPDPVGSGETLTYQMVVTNLSTTNDAGGVVIKATLPDGISFKSATPAGSCSASGAQVTCNVGTVAAGSSVTTSLETVSNTAGDISFTAQIVRANQPDPDSSNNSASITTKAAVGGSGGGTWSLGALLVGMIAYYLRRRSAIRLQPL